MADWIKSNLTYRIISAIIGIVVFLFFLYLGDLYLFSFILIICLIMTYELSRLLKTNTTIGLITSFLLVTIIGLSFFLNNWFLLIGPLIIFLLISVIININYSLKITFSSFYVSSLFFLLLTRNLSNGLSFAAGILVLIWIFDISAYFIGSKIGKHKIIPTISPGKSYEGLIGGMILTIFAVLISPFIADYLNLSSFQIPSLINLIILALVISITSFAGDIIESKIKRIAGVKDSGKIIPGHGGLLDRFDSLIVTLPVTYFLIVYYLHIMVKS